MIFKFKINPKKIVNNKYLIVKVDMKTEKKKLKFKLLI